MSLSLSPKVSLCWFCCMISWCWSHSQRFFTFSWIFFSCWYIYQYLHTGIHFVSTKLSLTLSKIRLHVSASVSGIKPSYALCIGAQFTRNYINVPDIYSWVWIKKTFYFHKASFSPVTDGKRKLCSLWTRTVHRCQFYLPNLWYKQ